MEYVACNLCQTTSNTFVYRRPDLPHHPDEWFDVVRCDECGLGFVNPRPSQAEIDRYYPANYYGQIEGDWKVAEYEAESRYLEGIKGDSELPPKLLDIGCAQGRFPGYMAERGWRVQGVEPYCTVPIDDFPVHRQSFDTLDGLDDFFDVVTAWGVIEHVHDPMAYFAQARRVLKPGGYFVFLVTNFESLSSKRLFKEDVPRHLYFFTPDTVNRFLAENGMELISADFDDRVQSIGSRGALNYLFTKYLLRRAYVWEDQPASYPGYCEAHGLQRGPVSMVRFSATHPVTCLDRIFEPVVIRWQKWRRTYGIAVYVARKTRMIL